MNVVIVKDNYCGKIDIFKLPKTGFHILNAGDQVKTQYINTRNKTATSQATCLCDSFGIYDDEDENSLKIIEDAFKKKSNDFGVILGVYHYSSWEDDDYFQNNDNEYET